MAAVPVESCQSLPNRSPWDRLGSVLYTCKRLRRVRHRFSHFGRILSAVRAALAVIGQGLLSEPSGSSRLPHRRRLRCRRLPTTRPTPEGVLEPICPRKKCAIWTRSRPVPVKNVNYPRAPSGRRSGLVGPYATTPIVNYEYLTSTPREGYFCADHARDVNICIWTSRKSVGHQTNDRFMVHGDGTRADGRRFK